MTQIDDKTQTKLLWEDTEDWITCQIFWYWKDWICYVVDVLNCRTEDVTKHLEPQKKARDVHIVWDIIYTYYNRANQTIGVWETVDDAIRNAKHNPEDWKIKNTPFPTSEPQKKAEVCTACYGKWTYSVFEWNKVASADFIWDKSYIVEKWGIKEYPCKRCNGTGEKPIYIPEPQQEDKLTINAPFIIEKPQQEDKKIKIIELYPLEPHRTSAITGREICDKINEIIDHINTH